jgi:hypothetical protein
MKKLYTLFLAIAVILTTSIVAVAQSATSPGPAATSPGLQFKYYPNPTAKDLYVDIQFLQLRTDATVEIRLISMIGKEMTLPYKVDVTSLSSHHYIDVSELPAGFYFMELVVTSNNTSNKFIRRLTKTD